MKMYVYGELIRWIFTVDCAYLQHIQTKWSHSYGGLSPFINLWFVYRRCSQNRVSQFFCMHCNLPAILHQVTKDGYSRPSRTWFSSCDKTVYIHFRKLKGVKTAYFKKLTLKCGKTGTSTWFVDTHRLYTVQ